MSIATTCRVSIVALFFAASPIAVWADRPVVEERPVDAAQLARVLGAQYIGKNVTLPEPSDHASVRLDFYRNGKLVQSKSNGGTNTQSKYSHFNVSVIVVDSDHLQLGNTPKQHYRFDVQIGIDDEEAKSSSSSTFDISKKEFGGRSGTGITGFGGASAREYHDPSSDAVDGTTMEIPLACYIQHEGRVFAGETPEETVRENPNSDVMIVYLVYNASGK